jgi:carboxymethylenebutenolidase
MFAVGGVTALGLLDMLKPNYALAQQVSFTDPDIVAEYVTYPSPNGHGEVRGYLVKPAGGGDRFPAVVVVHENRGLNPYIEDVARRLGKAGFMALAPDGLSSVGGYPGNDERGRELQSQVDSEKLLNDFFAAFEHLLQNDQTRPARSAASASATAVGCATPWRWPTRNLPHRCRSMAARPRPGDVARIEAPLLLHYAELDERINAGWPTYEAALNEHGKRYTVHFYEGTNHGFHNDSTPRYDEAAAELAWDRTIAFFNEHLK